MLFGIHVKLHVVSDKLCGKDTKTLGDNADDYMKVD